MSSRMHHVIIGNGVAGDQAAATLRERDSDSRITIVTAGTLLFTNRYKLPQVFAGKTDWREYLVHPPSYYEERDITVRRRSVVIRVDPDRRVLVLQHHEEVGYDRLLVAAGGAAYLPEALRESAHLLDSFATFRSAMIARERLPDGGTLIMLGGDMIGLDMARTVLASGYRVVLVPNERTFWPHQVAAEELPDYLGALERSGIEVVRKGPVERLEEGAAGRPDRRLVFADGSDLEGDVVMAFCGLVPSLGFMHGAGVDIERGLLVNPELRTTNERIWAAGDVCQIWSEEEKGYRFYYGWKNVKMMGEVAARNMTGDHVQVDTFKDEKLVIDAEGRIDSPYWRYD